MFVLETPWCSTKNTTLPDDHLNCAILLQGAVSNAMSTMPTPYTHLRNADPVGAAKANSLQTELLCLFAVEVERLIAEGVAT